MQEIISFVSEENRIEGILEKSTGEKGVVITHPHPFYIGYLDKLQAVLASCTFSKM